MGYQLWNALEELKSDAYEWVDLTHPLNNDSPCWAGIPEGSVELSKTCFDWGNPMLDCLIQTFKFPGQFGTHIDFPGHFVRNLPLAEDFGARHMLYPLCVIDVTEQVARDVHYAVTVEDIKAYEAKKNIQRFVFPDSDGERRFAEDLDAATEVAVYAKLPRTFQIPTPVGNYAPDWAIAFKEGSVRHVFFIAETKGTMDTMELSGVENAKIACAKKLFNEMSTSDVRYHNVATYEDLLEVMGRMS